MNEALLHTLLHSLTNTIAGGHALGSAPSESWPAYARFLFTARRRVLESKPCPPPVLRRVHGLFLRSHRSGSVASILHLVFDSWRDAAPALRGAHRERNLRFECEGMALDVRTSTSTGELGRIQAATEPVRTGLRLCAHGHGVETGAALDETGYAEMALEPGVADLVLVVRDGETELFRTVAFPLTE